MICLALVFNHSTVSFSWWAQISLIFKKQPNNQNNSHAFMLLLLHCWEWVVYPSCLCIVTSRSHLQPLLSDSFHHHFSQPVPNKITHHQLQWTHSFRVLLDFPVAYVWTYPSSAWPLNVGVTRLHPFSCYTVSWEPPSRFQSPLVYWCHSHSMFCLDHFL